MEGGSLVATGLLIGLMGGVHCVGMCGGIVVALHSPSSAFPVPVVTQTKVASAFSTQLAYNAGRLTSYALAGAIAGTLGSAALLFGTLRPLQHAGYWLANGFLVALGLYLAGVFPNFARIESLGKHWWKKLSPSAMHSLAVSRHSLTQAFSVGLLWGWVPCGLVYSALIMAMTSGSPTRGAAVLLAFGLGTLPNLLAAGVAARHLRLWLARRGVRRAAGAVVVGLGLLGLWHAHHVVQAEGGWFCTTSKAP